MQYSSWKSNFWVGSRVYLRISRKPAIFLRKPFLSGDIQTRRLLSLSLPSILFTIPSLRKQKSILGYQSPNNTQIAVWGRPSFLTEVAISLREDYVYLMAILPFVRFFVGIFRPICENNNGALDRKLIGRPSKTFLLYDVSIVKPKHDTPFRNPTLEQQKCCLETQET